MSLTLEHIVRKPQVTSTTPAPLLLLLHGLGSNENDLFSFASQLDPRYLVVSVRAPLAYGYGGFAWFNLNFTTGMPAADMIQFEQSRVKIMRFLEELQQQYEYDPKKIILAGFSQGAMMSYAVALTHPEKIYGMIGMSGYVVKDLAPKIKNRDALKQLKILATHGTYDQVLPVFLGRSTRDFLQTLPVEFTYKEYPMAHEVNPACLNDVRQWLAKQFV